MLLLLLLLGRLPCDGDLVQGVDVVVVVVFVVVRFGAVNKEGREELNT